LLKIGANIQRILQTRVRSNLEWLGTRLRNTPAGLLRVEGGWSAIIRLPQIQSEDVWVTRLIEEQNVIVQPGYFFDMGSEPYIVVSLIVGSEEFQEGVERLNSLLTRC